MDSRRRGIRRPPGPVSAAAGRSSAAGTQGLQSVTGAFEGWYQNPDGTYSLLVGYFNRNQKETFDIPIGPDNRIEPGGTDQGQPTHFLPRRQWGVFTITVPKDFGDKKLTWTLVANGQATVIPMTLNPLWVVEPFKDAGIGNTPPTLRFEPGGPAHQGPPHGIAAAHTASATEPLPLAVWVTDDGVRAPEARPRTGPPASVSWSTFRGPGVVTFAPAVPMVDEKDGKATTTATFSMAGETCCGPNPTTPRATVAAGFSAAGPTRS